jgi:hypothetical protein
MVTDMNVKKADRNYGNGNLGVKHALFYFMHQLRALI